MSNPFVTILRKLEHELLTTQHELADAKAVTNDPETRRVMLSAIGKIKNMRDQLEGLLLDALDHKESA